MLALGQRTGVSANMIKKYEHDDSMPGSGMLIKLSKALGVRTEYFFRPVKIELGEVEYRKRSSMPAATLKRIHADVLDQAERWHELANLWPDFPLKAFELPGGLPERVEALEEIEAIADGVRSSWQLGLNPIPDLVAELEAQGILVMMTDVDEAAKFDGLQAKIAGLPVIVVSTNWPGIVSASLWHMSLDICCCRDDCRSRLMRSKPAIDLRGLSCCRQSLFDSSLARHATVSSRRSFIC